MCKNVYNLHIKCVINNDNRYRSIAHVFLNTDTEQINRTETLLANVDGITTQVKFKFIYGPSALARVTDFMTIYRISLGKMALTFSFYFHFNINASTNIW